MQVEFRKSFAKDLAKIQDKALLAKVKSVIEDVESEGNLQKLSNIKKLKAQKGHYRIRLGEYRMGLTCHDNVVTFVRILHRKEIYRYFP